MAKARPALPHSDETSEETLFPRAPWSNPAPLSGEEALALLDGIRATMPPQSSSSLDLLREERGR